MFGLQLGRQDFLHHQPGPQEPGLDDPLVDAQHFSGVRDVELLYVTQNQNFPVDGRQGLERRPQQLAQLFAAPELPKALRASPSTPPERIRLRSSSCAASTESNFNTLSCRSRARASLMAIETSQVPNLASPRNEVRLLERLEHRLLRYIFSIVLVLQNGVRREVDAALVRPHQFVEELALARENARDQFTFL